MTPLEELLHHHMSLDSFKTLDSTLVTDEIEHENYDNESVWPRDTTFIHLEYKKGN